jgi:SAM-dependent methyltransferase
LKGKKVMDLGCGTGYFTFLMVDSGATIIAADIDDRFLAYVDSVRDARGISKKQVQTRKVPADNPMLDKREVDIVLIVNTYHHLQDRVNYLKKIKAGLKSTGYVVIIDYFKKDLPIGPPVDEKLSADDVTRELKMAGFSQFKTEDKSLPYQYIVFCAVVLFIDAGFYPLLEFFKVKHYFEASYHKQPVMKLKILGAILTLISLAFVFKDEVKVPKVWTAENLEGLLLPLADPSIVVTHLPDSMYYALEERVMYKTYPFYLPGTEPEGYYEWLKQQEPEIIFDVAKLKTPEDWIRAGEHVYDYPESTSPFTYDDSAAHANYQAIHFTGWNTAYPG